MALQWSTQKIASILQLSPPKLDLPVADITTDSRQVKMGSLFVAVPGDQFDGHDFIEQAIRSGAVAILTQKPVTSPGDAHIFQVQSTLHAIRMLAQTYRETFDIPFIGVVGAVGKTTTKELIASLLEGKYKNILKTEGSLNGFLGIPLTLLRLRPIDEIAVIEIGIDAIGAMSQHLALVQPTHLILTANGPEHLHQLKTVEIAASEELKAFDYALDHEKHLAINLSDSYVAQWFSKHQPRMSRKNYITFGLREALVSATTADFTGTHSALSRSLHIESIHLKLDFVSPLPGVHHAHNLLAATAIVSFFNLTGDQLTQGLKTFKTAYGRTELYHLPNQVQIIGDYYNSNPTSLNAAIQLLISSAQSGQSTIAVLGDMLELGHEEEQFHRQMAGSLMEAGITRVLLFGPRMKSLQDELQKKGYKNSIHFDDQESLLLNLRTHLEAPACVLIKGSRGMKMENVLRPLLETTH